MRQNMEIDPVRCTENRKENNFYNQKKKKNEVSHNEKRKKNSDFDHEKRKKDKVSDNEKKMKKKSMCIREPRKMKTMKRGSGCDIPDHIIYLILLRLPVKSLIRFKTVSKTWNARTTDPDFIREHHALQPSSKLLLVQRKEKDAHIYPMPLTFGKLTKSLCAHRNVYKPYKPYKPYVSDGSNAVIWVLGPCFGVFCIVADDIRYTLCNIATGVTKKVPYLRPRMNDEFWSVHGFGCVRGNTTSFPEFKIVRLAYFKEGRRVKCLTHVYTFTINSWKSIESCQSIIVGQGAELNGVIHWLAESFTTPRGTNNFIVTFDLKKEIFGRIEIPHCIRGALLTKQDDQCLSLIAPSSGCTDIWVMRYGESWIRQAKVGPSRVDSAALLGYWHNFKGLLLEDRGEEDMGIVMAIGNKHHKYCVQFSEAKLFTYVESLVSFNF